MLSWIRLRFSSRFSTGIKLFTQDSKFVRVLQAHVYRPPGATTTICGQSRRGSSVVIKFQYVATNKLVPMSTCHTWAVPSIVTWRHFLRATGQDAVALRLDDARVDDGAGLAGRQAHVDRGLPVLPREARLRLQAPDRHQAGGEHHHRHGDPG